MSTKQNLLTTIENTNSEFLNKVYESIYDIIKENNFSIEINSFGGFEINQNNISTFIIDSFNKLPIASDNKIFLVYTSGKLAIKPTNESFFDELSLMFYKERGKEKENNYSLKISSMTLKKIINENCSVNYLFGQDFTHVNFKSKGFFVSGLKIEHRQTDQFSVSSNLENVKNKFDSGVHNLFMILKGMNTERRQDIVDYLFKDKDFSIEEKDFFVISQDFKIDYFNCIRNNLLNKNTLKNANLYDKKFN